MSRLSKVKLEWSADFAYAVGLITSDGNLSPDGRHIHFTSKDYDLILQFKSCLKLQNKIGVKARGGSVEKKYFVIQFGDKNFYDFLLSLGLTPAKSKTLGPLLIPVEFFADFLRGCIDGDGNISVSNHPESQHFQLRVRLASASVQFLYWIKGEIAKNFNITGGWIQDLGQKGLNYYLAFGKSDSIIILKRIYYPGVSSYLSRKYLIGNKFLGEWRNWHTRTV